MGKYRRSCRKYPRRYRFEGMGIERGIKMAMYLYDPRYNTSQPITYDKIEAITGIKKGTLMTYKSRRLLIKSINCYIIDDKTPLKVRKELYAKQVIENEIWRPINHQYSVSDHGRFKKKNKNGKETYI